MLLCSLRSYTPPLRWYQQPNQPLQLAAKDATERLLYTTDQLSLHF